MILAAGATKVLVLAARIFVTAAGALLPMTVNFADIQEL